MSTQTTASAPLRITRGRAFGLPMNWQTPGDNPQPIAITGFTITAMLSGATGSPTITVTDAPNGKFKASIADTSGIPLGVLSRLNVCVVDTQGEPHDFDFPIEGVDP